MNNLNEIRKLFGCTQEDLAKLLGVSRVTISKMENDESYHMTEAQKEKLSLYFYIGPEYFEEKELDDVAKEHIIAAGKRVMQRPDKENTSQAEIVSKLVEISPIEAMKSYMISTKVLLVKADELTIEQFKDIIDVNEKLGIRLKYMLDEKKKQQGSNITEAINMLMEKYE